ncbi:hypothetical protein S245_008931 [Arachis hypogaea]
MDYTPMSFNNPFSALLAVLFDDDAPLRRVCSTGDLHGTHGSIMHNNNESSIWFVETQLSMFKFGTGQVLLRFLIPFSKIAEFS